MPLTYDVIRIADRWFPVAVQSGKAAGVWHVLVKGAVGDCAAYCAVVIDEDMDEDYAAYESQASIAQWIARHGSKIREAEALAIFGHFNGLKYRE